MSKRNYNRKDHLYMKAKEEGYQSRASYKLIELNKKYALLKPGFKVLDLGAWPGGWMQVASEAVGPRGLVVGIDFVEIAQIGGANTHSLQGDVADDEVIKKAFDLAGGKFDLVVSDMSPKLTGIKDLDRTAAVGCAELALFVAQRTLRAGGNFVAKVFKGNETEEFYRATRPFFERLVRIELDSTRRTSNEFYIVGFGLKANSQQ